MITVARLIVKAALTRKGSVGAHYRSDYKDRGKDWLQHLSWNKRNFSFGENSSGDTRRTESGVCKG